VLLGFTVVPDFSVVPWSVVVFGSRVMLCATVVPGFAVVLAQPAVLPSSGMVFTAVALVVLGALLVVGVPLDVALLI
jgi:hypothetical protein